jgi:hypothetical protein
MDGEQDDEVTHGEKTLERHREVLDKIEALERRLFKDNGRLSIQTRLDRHEQILKVLAWAMSVVGGALLTSAVAGLVLLFKWALSHGGGM